MYFGCKPSARTSYFRRIAPFLAPQPYWWTQTEVLSIDISCKSTSMFKSANICTKTPLFTSSWKKSYTVLHEPYLSGKSRQGAPVLAIANVFEKDVVRLRHPLRELCSLAVRLAASRKHEHNSSNYAHVLGRLTHVDNHFAKQAWLVFLKWVSYIQRIEGSACPTDGGASGYRLSRNPKDSR